MYWINCIFYLYFLDPLQLPVANPISVPKSRQYANLPKIIQKAIELFTLCIKNQFSSQKIPTFRANYSWGSTSSLSSINLLVILKWSERKNNVGRLVRIVYRYSQTFSSPSGQQTYIFWPVEQGCLNLFPDIYSEIIMCAYNKFR